MKLIVAPYWQHLIIYRYGDISNEFESTKAALVIAKIKSMIDNFNQENIFELNIWKFQFAYNKIDGSDQLMLKLAKISNLDIENNLLKQEYDKCKANKYLYEKELEMKQIKSKNEIIKKTRGRACALPLVIPIFLTIFFFLGNFLH